MGEEGLVFRKRRFHYQDSLIAHLQSSRNKSDSSKGLEDDMGRGKLHTRKDGLAYPVYLQMLGIDLTISHLEICFILSAIETPEILQ